MELLKGETAVTAGTLEDQQGRYRDTLRVYYVTFQRNAKTASSRRP